MTEEEITMLCNSLDDIHMYDPHLVNMTDEEYEQFLQIEAEMWEDDTIHK